VLGGGKFDKIINDLDCVMLRRATYIMVVMLILLPLLQMSLATSNTYYIRFSPPYTFHSGGTYAIYLAALNDTRFVVCYEDADSNYFFKVGSLSGGVINFGNEITFDRGYLHSIAALDSTHIVILYDTSEQGWGATCIGTISGDTITFGDEYIFENVGDIGGAQIDAMDSTHFVIAWARMGEGGEGEENWCIKACIGVVSGDVISYGETYDVYNYGSGGVLVTSLSSTQFVIAYSDNSMEYRVKVGTVSGTSITFGDETIIQEIYAMDALDDTHIVTAYASYESGSRCQIGTVSGNTITFGSEYEIAQEPIWISQNQQQICALNSTNFIVAYMNETNVGKAKCGTVSGDTISFGSAAIFSNNAYYPAVCALNDTYFVTAYPDRGENYNGKTVIGKTSTVISSVNGTSPYWHNHSPVDITASTTDDSLVINVSLYYRFSSDNSTWSEWRLYGTDTSPPWEWTFDFPDGEGYYEFYSSAYSTAGSERPWPPAIADTIAGYDATPPSSSVNPISPYWQYMCTMTITATSTDSLSGTSKLQLYYRYSSDNSTWSEWRLYGTDTSPPWEWTFDFPDGGGYYEFYSIATDNAGNQEEPPVTADAKAAHSYEYVFNPGKTEYISIDSLNSTNFVVSYQDESHNLLGTAIIGTISGNSISFGSEYVFGNSHDTSVSSLDSTHFIVAYADWSKGNNGTAVIGTVSDASISYSSKYTFNPDETYEISTSALSATKFVIAYDDYNSNTGAAIIGIVSDNSISFGSEYIFHSGRITCTSIATLDSSKFVVAYGNDNFQAVRVGEVSGTTISWGAEYIFSPCTHGISVTALDSTHIVVARKGESEEGIAVVGTVSGNTISFGAEVVFHSGSLYSYFSDSLTVEAMDNSHVIIAYVDKSDGYKGKYTIGRVSGDTIIFGSEYTFNPNETHYIRVSRLTSTKFVIAYRDDGNNEYGTIVLGEVDETPPTSTVITSQYWFSNPATITATASDDKSGVDTVKLYYRFSLDNSTWSDWTLYGTDTNGSDGWNWTFDFPDGMGYYQLHSIATDKAGNTESKTTADVELGRAIPCYFTYSYPVNKHPILFTDVSAISTYTKWIIDGITVAEQTFPNGSHPPFNLTYTFNISNIYNITLWVYNETFDVSNTYTVNLPVKRNLTLDLSPSHIGINYVAYHLNTTTNASALMDLLNLNRGEWIHKYNESTNKWMSLWKYNDTVKLGDNFDIHPWDVVVVVISNNRTITIDITEKVNTTQTKTLQKGYHYLSWSNNTSILSCDITKIGLQEGDWVFKYDLQNETWLSYNVGLSGDIFEIKPYDCIVVNLADERTINIGG